MSYMGSLRREQIFGLEPMIFAVALQLILWSLGPLVLFGNLHSDSLEAAYWGREWMLGYSKHPPLASWIMDLALHVPLPPILSLMLLSQITVAITALFVWKTTRLFASHQTAALAVALYLASPAATIYAIQINHNSMLAPFWSGAFYFGLLFLEERRWRDAILLGLLAGLGMITKYEIAFVLVTLLALGLAVPRFRPAFHHPASYVSGAIFIAILLPHVLWLQKTGWSSVGRALGNEKITDLSLLNASGVNLLVGIFTLFIVPGLILMFTARRRAQDELTTGSYHRLIALALAFMPLMILIVMSVITVQVIKPLWVLPLASSTAIGLAVLFPAGHYGEGQNNLSTAKLSAILSGVIFGGLTLYLLVAVMIGKPLAAYSLNLKELAQETQRFWAERSKAPLTCVIIAERKIGPSGVLWLPGHVTIAEGWRPTGLPESCKESGAVAVYPSDATSLLRQDLGLCPVTERVTLRATPPLRKTSITAGLAYLPPQGTVCPSDR